MNFGIFLLLLIPAILVAGVAKFFFNHSICWKEFGCQIGACFLVIGIAFGLSLVNMTIDHQVLSGEITGKKKVWTSCEHDYECPPCWEECTTYSDGEQSCHTECSTCYEHSNDWDWEVYSNIDNGFTVSRIDEQGVKEPPRYTAVKIGEPYATTSMYQNYIKAAPESLFNFKHMKLDQFAGMIPAYPTIYDYHRINRVIPVGVQVPDLAEWNTYLSERMKKIGRSKQANIIIILTSTPDQTYRYALESAWLGGKKNDVIVLIGVRGKDIVWADTITLGSNAGNSLMTVMMRNRILDLQTIERKAIIDTVANTVTEKFDRKPMADYEYLKSNIMPSNGAITFCLFLGLAVSIGLSVYFHKNRTF